MIIQTFFVSRADNWHVDEPGSNLTKLNGLTEFGKVTTRLFKAVLEGNTLILTVFVKYSA